MPRLEKAKLEPVRADRNNSSAGDEVEVQFNPTSLRLTLTNQSEGGRSRGRQRRQHTGNSSTVLAMQLIFDSADETEGQADNPQPVSVRKKTAMVEQFVLPKEGGSETPPLLKFSWNGLVVIGIVENVRIEFDFFASDGKPLRAKVDLSIKEQDPRYQFLRIGAGARQNRSTQNRADDVNAWPGADGRATGAAQSDRSAPALEDESAPEFAARMGLDPSAWRGLDADLSAGLGLEAGIDVGFSADVSLNAGIGFSAGFRAGADISLEASLGLEANASASAGFAANLSAEASAGFALSAAGGVYAAIESAKSIGVKSAAKSAKDAFTPAGDVSMAASSVASGVAATSSADNSDGTASAILSAGAENSAIAAESDDVSMLNSLQRSRKDRMPLWKSGHKTAGGQRTARMVAPARRVDKRAIGFGYGAPLKPQIPTTWDLEQPKICRAGLSGSAKSVGVPEFASDPTVSPWEKLPARDEGRKRSETAEKEKRLHPCHLLYRKRATGGLR